MCVNQRAVCMCPTFPSQPCSSRANVTIERGPQPTHSLKPDCTRGPQKKQSFVLFLCVGRVCGCLITVVFPDAVRLQQKGKGFHFYRGCKHQSEDVLQGGTMEWSHMRGPEFPQRSGWWGSNRQRQVQTNIHRRHTHNLPPQASQSRTTRTQSEV